MSLRGSGTTEAISYEFVINEIAALPSVARNDQKALRHSHPERLGTSPQIFRIAGRFRTHVGVDPRSGRCFNLLCRNVIAKE